MASFLLTSSPLPEEAHNQRIYQGDLIVFRGFAAVTDLVDGLRAICRQHLGAGPETEHGCRSSCARSTGETCRPAGAHRTLTAPQYAPPISASGGLTQGERLGPLE